MGSKAQLKSQEGKQKVSDMESSVTKLCGQVIALINNAAVFLDGWDEALFDSVLTTNFRTPIQLSERLLPHMAPGECHGFRIDFDFM